MSNLAWLERCVVLAANRKLFHKSVLTFGDRGSSSWLTGSKFTQSIDIFNSQEEITEKLLIRLLAGSRDKVGFD